MAKTKPFFEPLSPSVDFPKLEEELLKEWNKKGIVKKYLEKNKSSKKIFSFLDGPITANNPMGVHHAWGRTYKDLWQRFYNMKGYRQRFQNGFDCQGLWVEVEVEKELGLKSKKDIENLVPGDKNYMIWHFLKKCHEKGLIYKGRDSVPWCPRCGTAISQHEMLTEDYKEATHESVYMEYPIKGRKKEYLLVWTTTPWTLPGNVAVAVDEKKEYVVATGKVAGNVYYLGEKAALKLGLKVERKLKGKELV